MLIYSILIIASEATSTTPRSSPPWLITSQPSVWGTSTIRYATTRTPLSEPTGESTIKKNLNNGALDTANRPKSVTRPNTTNGNDTFSSSTNQRNNENASVAAVTKSAHNNSETTSAGNTIASSTFSVLPKANR